jgi:2Fe-2S ferredoxin
MPVVTFYNEHRSIEAEPGTNLRHFMLRSGVTPYRGLTSLTNCRGHNVCGTCAVEVMDGKGVSPRSEEENSTLGGNFVVARTVGKNIRLACQAKIIGDVVVKTHPVRPVDRQATTKRVELTALVAVFVLAMAGMLVYLFLDMIKKF